MRHRHLESGFETNTAAIADVLERGTLTDWQELARQMRANPTGPHAKAVRRITDRVHYYGTTILWQDYLARCLQEANQENRKGLSEEN